MVSNSKSIYNSKQFARLLCLLIFALFTTNANCQDESEKYSRNFKFFGTIIDKATGKPMANTCFVVYGLDQVRKIKSNEKGEYEILFYDNNYEPQENNYNLEDDEILIGWCEDPNKTKTFSLKKTRVKKSNTPDDFSKPPIVIKLNFTLDYEF